MAKTQGDHVVKGKFAADGNAKFNKALDSPYLEVIDRKANGNQGGTFTGKTGGAHSWRTRDLTNVLFNDFATAVVSGANDLLAGDAATAGEGGKITLEKGVYYIEASCPALSVDEHTARLADVTDNPGSTGSTVVLGTSEFAADNNIWEYTSGNLIFLSSATQSRSIISGKFQLTSQRTLEIQHQCASSQTNNGFGSDGAFYITPNIYTTVKMWRIRDDR